MATNKQLKFYKVQSLPATLVVGAIYFEVSTQRICVAKSTTEFDAFGVGLKSATLVDSVLTITRFDNTTVTVDFSDIASAKSVQDALSGLQAQINDRATKTELSDAVSGVNKTIADLNTAYKAADVVIEGKITAASTAASDALSAAKGELEGKINLKANASDVYTKTESNGLLNDKADKSAVYTKDEVDGFVNTINQAAADKAAADLLVHEDLQDQIDELSEGLAGVEVKHLDGDKYVEVSKDGSVYTVKSKGIDDAISTAVAAEAALRAADKSELQGNIDTEKGRIDVLVGNVEGDDAKSVRTISAEEVAKIVAGADEDYDTLKEIADWIAAHPDSVAALNSAIVANTKAIEDEAKARAEADSAHTQAIADLNSADEAQDLLIAAKADKSWVEGQVSTLNTAIEGNGSLISGLDTRMGAAESKIAANEGAISANTAAIALKASQADFNTLSGKVTANEGAISDLNTEVDNLEAATGFEGQYVANASANYISGAISLKDADDKLDAAIKAVAQSVSDKNVTAEGDGSYVTATAANNKVTVSAVRGNIEENGEGLATNAAVFNALCWVEFN